MRRLVFPTILASGLVVLGAVPASAEPAPVATQAKAVAGKKVCKVTDPLLNELSGIVATDDGYVVINDSSEGSRRRVFYLDGGCDITKKVEFSGNGPRDTEDLVLSPDGKTLWIADTGDNGVRQKPPDHRDTVSVWTMPVDGSKQPKIHRLKYPSGDYHDAEALLLDGSGKPIIVTKEITGTALLYTPSGPLKTNNTEGVPLKRVGQVQLPRTDTEGSALARLAQGVVTGGAVGPGGTKVVLRTYLDAFEWDVANGDVVAALKNKPRVTGLPNEPGYGEAITYSADGKTFATVSDFGDVDDEDTANHIRRYTPATQVVQAKAAAKGGKASDDGPSWFSELSISDITYLVGGVGVLGAILVGAGIFGIVRARKKPLPEPPAKPTEGTGPKPIDAETELLSVGGPPQRPAYGSGAAASAPGVYGAKGSGVYGGAPASGRPGAAAPGGRPGAAQPGRPAGTQGRPAAGQPAPAGHPAAGGHPGRPGTGQPGRPGGGQPVRPAGPPAGQPPRPAGGQPGRPAVPPAGQPARPGGQPARPAGQPARPAGGQPARPAGQPARPAGGQPARPAGQPARPAGGQPGRPAGGQPGRPAVPPAGQPARPGGGQPARPASGQPARPAGGQPARPAGQPARPAGGQPARPAGGQPGRPGGGGQPGRSGSAPPAGPPRGGQPGARPAGDGRGGGVYGAPPPPPPPGGGGGRQAGTSRPTGFHGTPGAAQTPSASRQNGPINSMSSTRDGRPDYGPPRGY